MSSKYAWSGFWEYLIGLVLGVALGVGGVMVYIDNTKTTFITPDPGDTWSITTPQGSCKWVWRDDIEGWEHWDMPAPKYYKVQGTDWDLASGVPE